MEEAEKTHIKNTWDTLIHGIKCNVSVLGKLFSQNLISQIEKEALKNLRTDIEKASKLLDILVTRVGAYGKLVNILETDCQSGMVAILNNIAVANEDNYLNFGKLTTESKAFLNSKVHRGKFGNRVVAVKIVRRVERPPEEAIKLVDLLTKLDSHENILRYFTTTISHEDIRLVLEHCDKNLKTWIRPDIKPEQRLDLAYQITCGLHHLHSHDIVNLSIFPASILVICDNHRKLCAKIANFKLAAETTNGSVTKKLSIEKLEKPGWFPLEILQPLDEGEGGELEINLNLSADVFSLGCVYHFVFTGGLHPFGSRLKRTKNILDEQKAANFGSCLSGYILGEKYETLITQMISSDFEIERPNTETLLGHEIFSNKLHSCDNSSSISNELKLCKCVPPMYVEPS